MACPDGHDQAFGPRVDPACRPFDFTLRFEDVVLASVPAAILIALVPAELAVYWRRPCISSLKTRLLACHITLLLGLLATQLALLVLRREAAHLRSSASLAADILVVLASIGILVHSVIHHQRSSRSSSVVSLYFSVYCVLGVARARTLWHIDPAGPAAVTSIASLLFTASALAADSVKRFIDRDRLKNGVALEQTIGFWNRAVFAWLATTLRLGYARLLSVDDLPHLDTRLGSDKSHLQLASSWNGFNRHRRHSLLGACFHSFSWSFMSAIIPRLCLTCFTFSQPFLLNSTVLLVQQAHPDTDFGRGLIGAWALAFVGIAVSNSIFQYQNFRFVTRVRGSLTALVYEQALSLHEADKDKITAMAILGADIPQIVAGLQYLHEVWASSLDVAIATWLLAREISLACLAPSVLVLMFVSITTRISKTTNVRQRRWIEKIQERLRVTSSLLGNIKAVKMLGLTRTVSGLIQRLRQDEIRSSTAYRKILLSVLLLSNTPLNLAPTVTFAVYVIISVYWKGSTLQVSQAFSALALISLLTSPVMLFTQILPRVWQAVGCFDRVQEYCNYGCDDMAEDTPRSSSARDCSSQSNDTNAYDLAAKSSSHSQDISIGAQNFRWKRDGPAVLRNINLSFITGTITAIIGPVGSGKTTLLESLLGETISSTSLHGQRSSASASYCSQQPWLENKTVRESIIGENEFDDKWYGTVKRACDLEAEFLGQAQHDKARVGSKGIGLSGGQRQRIALARAIYARSSLTILDDAFSGMDAHTVEAISSRLFGSDGLLRALNRTVVLSTSNPIIIAQADRIIALDNGEIISDNSIRGLAERSRHVPNIDGTVLENDSFEEIPGDSRKLNVHTAIADATASDEVRPKQGPLTTYKYYFSRSGYWLLIGNLLSVGVWIFLTEFSTIWVKWWSEDNEISPNRNVGVYMGLYATFGIVGTLASCLGGWFLLVRMISKSAESLHSDLLTATLNAPFWFFATTDTGEIMNRFSQDIELVDMALPAMVSSFITSSTQCFIKLVILLIFSQYLGAAVPILGAVIYFLQRFYLRTSRQVRLLGIEAKAPLYTFITDCVDGAVTIRAFGWQSKYMKKLYHKIDYFQRPEYMQSCIQHWLTFVLDIIAATLAVIVVAVIVTWHDHFDTGSVGVALVMLIGFSTSLMRVIKSWTTMESSIGAVGRIKQFVDETETEVGIQVPQPPDCTWPQHGAMRIQNLAASHSLELDPVLKRVSLDIRQTQHIAVCGRTGSGKTSLILAILRMMHIKHGSVTIDGIDISSTSPEQIRKSLNVVPQDPFLMPGSVRFNADPDGEASDEKIMQALTRVNLSAIVHEQGGLIRDMDSSAWSAGQKQLFCLARAMIRKSRILILDEAMSSVDYETGLLMQDIIDNEFKDTTVLAIMHRMDHVTRYDKVAVFEDGELVEFDEPAKLIAGDSRFAELWRAHRTSSQ